MATKVILLERCVGLSETTEYELFEDGKKTLIPDVRSFIQKERELLNVKETIPFLEYWLEDSHGSRTAQYQYVNGVRQNIRDYKAGRTKEDIYG